MRYLDMTVGELIKALQGMPDSMEVVYPDWWVFSESSQTETDFMRCDITGVEFKNGQVYLW